MTRKQINEESDEEEDQMSQLFQLKENVAAES